MIKDEKYRSWCFTMNNPEKNELELGDNVRYAVWQLEMGDRGTPHLQGYIEFDGCMRRAAIKKIIGNSVHLEPRHGPREKARSYCMKECSRLDGPWEYGTWITGQGHRTDIDTLHKYLKDGVSEKDICNNDFPIWVKHYRSIERYHILNPKKRCTRTRLYSITGDPGTGKSTLCRDLAYTHAGCIVYHKPPGSWWCGCDNMHACILDEVDRDPGIDLPYLLRLADKTPMLVPIKGSQRDFNALQMYLTSNINENEWYPKEPPIRYHALMRRVDATIKMTWVQDGNFKRVRRTTKVYCVDPTEWANHTLPMWPIPILEEDITYKQGEEVSLPPLVPPSGVGGPSVCQDTPSQPRDTTPTSPVPWDEEPGRKDVPLLGTPLLPVPPKQILGHGTRCVEGNTGDSVPLLRTRAEKKKKSPPKKPAKKARQKSPPKKAREKAGQKV
jgi:hypothetical protein